METECSSWRSQKSAMGHSRKPKKSVYTLHGRIEVRWGLKFMQLMGPSFRRRIQIYEYELSTTMNIYLE